jgi:arylsulfatase A-like enzyme
MESDTQITATVPIGSTTGTLRVSGVDGTATTADTFTVASPNIVLILTDDQRSDQLSYMPTVQSELVAKGTTFTNAFVVNPLCCPSRSTILTGEYSHDTGVYKNLPPYGGFSSFKDLSTIATWLNGAGYRTALVGKYLNGYKPTDASYVPPGWSTWDALSLLNGQGGDGKGGYYNYGVSENGSLVQYGSTTAEYSTDVFSGLAADFIHSVPSDQPLFLYFAPRAPHSPATPPPRYFKSFADLPPLRPPSYNEADMSDKPAWAQALPLLTESQQAGEDAFYRRQLKSLLAVDDAVANILTSLEETGRLSNTLIMFASDNGLLAGEHRWRAKEVPWEESVRIPLVIRYDPLTRGSATTVNDLTLNLDFAQTFAQAAGAQAPGAEGLSLIPLLTGSGIPWRSDFLIEHIKTAATKTTVPAYCAVRTQDFKYVEWATGEEELYDLNADPHELQSLAGDPAYTALLATMRDRTRELCNPPPPGMTLSH